MILKINTWLHKRLTKNKVLTVKRLNSKTLKETEQKEQAKKREDIKCKGLLYIIEAIIDSGKPMVGHNCLLDILHTYRQFLYPLPESLDKFKQLLNSVFPKLLDTKLIASVEPLKTFIPVTVLGDIFSLISNTPSQCGLPKVDVKLPRKYTGKAAAHTAWYDAYMTGHCFAIFNAFLEIQLEKPTKEEAFHPLKRWRRIQELTRHFWKHWLQEWIPSLSPRQKWHEVRII